MLALIFGFSSQNGETSGNLSSKISYKIVQIGDGLLGAHLSETELDIYAEKIEFPVRKLAHMTEYFLLALSIALPCHVHDLKGRSLFLTTFALCVLFAAGDEYHQSFVAGRGPSVRDVLIDSTGAALALICLHLLRHHIHFGISRPGKS
ncbi:VanZ family protein [Roseburia hominis]